MKPWIMLPTFLLGGVYSTINNYLAKSLPLAVCESCSCWISAATQERCAVAAVTSCPRVAPGTTAAVGLFRDYPAGVAAQEVGLLRAYTAGVAAQEVGLLRAYIAGVAAQEVGLLRAYTAGVAAQEVALLRAYTAGVAAQEVQLRLLDASGQDCLHSQFHCDQIWRVSPLRSACHQWLSPQDVLHYRCHSVCHLDYG